MSSKSPLRPLEASDLAIKPIEQAETIPAHWYTDPRMFELDKKVLFERSWHFVGHTSQLPTPGSYVTARIGEEAVIVVRGKDMILRAFFNVCRHRGGPIEIEDSGCVRMLQCKYHGWTYTLDGSLRGVPRFDRVDLFDKKDFGLVPVDLESWEGLLFVRLSPDAGHLAEKMEGIRERIHPIDLSTLHFARRVVYEVACNWKTYVDNYLEGYHLPYVHPELCSVLDIARYTTELHPMYSLQYSPLSSEDNIYASGPGTAFYYHLFPHFTLNILPGRLQTNTILPAGVEKTVVTFDFFYVDVESEEALQRIAQDVSFSDQVQQEDVDICEHVQRGLHSRSYGTGRFSVECEEGVYHFQSLLKAAYAELMNEKTT